MVLGVNLNSLPIYKKSGPTAKMLGILGSFTCVIEPALYDLLVLKRALAKRTNGYVRN